MLNENMNLALQSAQSLQLLLQCFRAAQGNRLRGDMAASMQLLKEGIGKSFIAPLNQTTASALSKFKLHNNKVNH